MSIVILFVAILSTSLDLASVRGVSQAIPLSQGISVSETVSPAVSHPVSQTISNSQMRLRYGHGGSEARIDRGSSLADLVPRSPLFRLSSLGALPSKNSLLYKAGLLQAPGLSGHVIERAVSAIECAVSKKKLRLEGLQTLGVIDYSLPSTRKRFWLFNISTHRVLFNGYVAHGKNSGENFAARFSNEPGSLATSLGLYMAGQTYYGQHGLSLRLHGLDRNFNDKAYERAIVMHGADYVSESFIENNDRLGRSWGCPALSREAAPRIINTLKDGGVLFAYANDAAWLQNSSMLRC